MKRIYLYIIVSIAFCLVTASCDKDLPFPIDEVTRGVVIDIVKSPNSDQTLVVGKTTGNYKVDLLIPTQQGDYSMMANAELLAILSSGGTTTSQVVVNNITNFPSTVTINMAEVYSKFGKTAPVLGETLNFTLNVVLKSGEVVPGWHQLKTEVNGKPVYTNIYNNQAFAGWNVGTRKLSYRVQYSVVNAAP